MGRRCRYAPPASERTDTTFALGILSLVGGVTPRVRSFLLTLVIVDDIVALLVIALAYTADLSYTALAVADASGAVGTPTMFINGGRYPRRPVS